MSLDRRHIAPHAVRTQRTKKKVGYLVLLDFSEHLAPRRSGTLLGRFAFSPSVSIFLLVVVNVWPKSRITCRRKPTWVPSRHALSLMAMTMSLVLAMLLLCTAAGDVAQVVAVGAATRQMLAPACTVAVLHETIR